MSSLFARSIRTCSAGKHSAAFPRTRCVVGSSVHSQHAQCAQGAQGAQPHCTPTRSFHISVAAAVGPRSPATRLRANMAAAGEKMVFLNDNAMHLFETAINAKFLDMDIEQARMLGNAVMNAPVEGEPAIRKLLMMAEGDASLVTKISLTIARDIHCRRRASWVLQKLSFLGEPLAIIFIVQQHLRAQHSSVSNIHIEALRKMAEEGKIPQAIALYGRILLANGNKEKAAKYFKKAMDISQPVKYNESIDAFFSPSEPQPWELYGSTMADLGDPDAARDAVEIGRNEYDHARAYTVLATTALFEKDWHTAEQYLTKSAMDGNLYDCYRLGKLYLRMVLLNDSRYNPFSASELVPADATFRRRYSQQVFKILAGNWMSLAVTANNSEAAVAIACMLHACGHAQKALMWLDRAESYDTCPYPVHKLRESWGDRYIGRNILHEILKRP